MTDDNLGRTAKSLFSQKIAAITHPLVHLNLVHTTLPLAATGFYDTGCKNGHCNLLRLGEIHRSWHHTCTISPFAMLVIITGQTAPRLSPTITGALVVCLTIVQERKITTASIFCLIGCTSYKKA